MAPRGTALHDREVALGGRMVDFHGWHLPLQFSGILQEHEAVRTHAGLFDVSHMGKLVLRGPGSADFLDRLSPNPVAREAGMAKYTHLLREDGTILDDVIVACLGRDDYLMVCNGAPREAVVAWLRSHGPPREFQDLTFDLVCLALQGPRAAAILQGLTPHPLGTIASFGGALVEFLLPEGFHVQRTGASGAEGVPVEMEGWGSHTEGLLRAFGRGPMSVARRTRAAEVSFVTRTGYTGEDGFEIIAPNPVGQVVWDALLWLGEKEGVKPCGLGARDTLRLEMGYLLSGQDFDGHQTTLETGYQWLIKWDHDFVGKAALERQKLQGNYQRWMGLVLEDRGIPRSGQEVWAGGKGVGRVTSGTLSPTLHRGIAMAYLDPEVAKVGERVEVGIRGRNVGAQVVKPPFVHRGGRPNSATSPRP